MKQWKENLKRVTQFGDDFSDEYTEDRIIEVTPTGVYVSGMDLEIAFSDMAWNEQKNAWVDDIAYDIIEMETPLDASLSELDNKMLRLMSNAATSTTGIKDVPNFQIRPMMRSTLKEQCLRLKSRTSPAWTLQRLQIGCSNTVQEK